MKTKILLLLLLITIQSNSQVSTGSRHLGPPGKFGKGVLEKFKKTETIFVLSDIYDKSVYEKVLKDSWTVTPYKVVDAVDFDIDNYLNGNYSFVRLGAIEREIRTKTNTMINASIFAYVDFVMFDSEKILKRLNKLSPKKRKKKKKNIIKFNTKNIARFYLFPKDDFTQTVLDKEMDEVVASLYTDDVFFNYLPGFLKNYFQKVNNLIKNEEVYWLYKSDYLPELKKLMNHKLYIPSYMNIKFNGWTGKSSKRKPESIKKIFEKYEYQYEIISDEDLSDKIMNNQEIYYLRYVRTNSERFLQVVNSKTGEIVYRKYIPGFSYNIKSKHVKDLNNKIKRAAKK